MYKQFRYPGARPFTPAQKRIFFGRQQDVEDLYQSVTINQVVTLYAKSGMGKSSLINAGLTPKVEHTSRLKIIPIRFGAYISGNTESPVRKVVETIKDEYRSVPLGRIMPEQENSIWYHAKNRYHLHTEHPEGLLLVFDQFEELFTYPETALETFGREMSELLYTAIPDRFREKLEDILNTAPETFSEEELQWLHQPIDVRIIMAIRSDRMSLLNQLKPFIPNILENCFELKALSHEQAEDAILNPAFHPETFASPIFDYEDEAVENMIDFLSDEQGQNVESFQLQILCEHVERQIVIGQGRKLITKEDLSNPELILENYYFNKIDEISDEADRLAARKLIEEGLVFEEEERRITLYEGQLKKVYDIHPQLLTQLLDTHLIRSEASMRGGYTYELSHDTLVAPVLRAKARRLEKERKAVAAKEKAKREAEVRELKKKADKERRRAEKENELRVIAEENEKKAKRLSQIAMWVTSLAVILAILTGWSYSQARRSAQSSMRQTIKALGTNLAYRAQDVLEKGDRSTALQLAALTFQYLDSTNVSAAQLLSNALFINDNADISTVQRIPWSGKLIGHGSQLTAVVFSPDGNRIYTAAGDRTLRQWEPRTGIELQLLTFDKPLVALASDPRGTYLAGLETDGILRIWNLESMSELRIINTGEANGREIAFSPDGRLIATGSDDNYAKIWEVETGSLLHTLEGHTQSVHGLAFSPDGLTLLTGSRDSTAILWDVVAGMPVRTFEGHTNKLADVAFSPTGEHIATGSLDNTVVVWSVTSGNKVSTLEGHKGYIEAVRFSPDGQWLATGSWDATVKLWNTLTGEEVSNLSGHDGVISAVAFSPDGQLLASTATDHTCRIWELTPEPIAKTLSGHTGTIESADFSSDGTRLLTASRDQTARIWNVDQLQEELILRGHSNRVIHAAWSPDDQFVATASYDSTARFWDVGTGEELLRLEHPAGVVGIDHSPDGEWLVTACLDSMVRVFQLPNGESQLTLEGFEGPATKVVVSPKGQFVAACSRDHTALIWNRRTGEVVQHLRGHAGPLEGIAFSPDGHYLATASWDQTIKVWNVASGETEQTLRAHNAFVISVVFSPDGRYLMSTALDKTAILWDLLDGKPLFTFRGHQDFVIGAAYSPDGNTVATVSRDQQIKLWTGSVRSFANTTGLVVQPGELDAGQLYDHEVLSTIEAAPRGLEKFIKKANVQQLKALGQAYERQAGDENRRRFLNRNYRKAESCFFPLYGRLDSQIVDYYLADLYIGWSRKLLSLERWNEAAEKGQNAQQLFPSMFKVQRHAALINMIRDKSFGTAALELLQLGKDDRLDVLEEVKLWRNYPSFFTNEQWQAHTEKLIHLLDLDIDAADARSFQQRYGILELRFNEIARETILEEIEDTEIQQYIRNKWIAPELLE